MCIHFGLWCTNAFDRVSRIQQFHKMNDVSVHMNWYGKIASIVRWDYNAMRRILQSELE